MARREMRDVILGDDGEPDATAGPSAGVADVSQARPGGQPGSLRGLLRHRRRRLAAAGVLLVVAVAAVGQWQARGSALALSDDPEALDELKPTLTELWRVPAGAENMNTVSGDLFIAEVPIDGRQHVIAFETATGARRWTITLPDPASSWRGCDVLGDRATEVNTHVVCRVASVVPGQPATRHGSLYVLDARTGDVIRRRPLVNPDATFDRVGTDLLVVDTSPEGNLEATREDPTTGQVHWTYRSAEPLPPPRTELPEFNEQHGYLVAEGRTPIVLSPEGTVLWERGAPPADTFDLGPDVDLTVLSDGKVGIGGDYPSEPPEAYGNVKSLSGDNVYALPGPVLELEPDDGTAGDLLLTQSLTGDAIIALDSEPGEERWRAETGRVSQALVIDRRLLVNTEVGVVRALDTANGRTLWEAAVVPAYGGLWTDGRLALVATQDDEDTQLTALDVADGRPRWNVPIPDDVLFYIQSSGRLYLAQLSTLIALGSPPPR